MFSLWYVNASNAIDIWDRQDESERGDGLCNGCGENFAAAGIFRHATWPGGCLGSRDRRTEHRPSTTPWFVFFHIISAQTRLTISHTAFSSQSALFNFQSLLLVILLLICTCTYIRAVAPRLIDSNKQGYVLSVFFAMRGPPFLLLQMPMRYQASFSDACAHPLIVFHRANCSLT